MITTNKSDKVLFWCEGVFKKTDKAQLLRFLVKKSGGDYAGTFRRDMTYGRIYYSTYDLIIKNLSRTACIQVYSDGVIRLHLEHSHFEEPRSIFSNHYKFVDDSLTEKMLEELKEYFSK